jgi:hypothetical protein
MRPKQAGGAYRPSAGCSRHCVPAGSTNGQPSRSTARASVRSASVRSASVRTWGATTCARRIGRRIRGVRARRMNGHCRLVSCRSIALARPARRMRDDDRECPVELGSDCAPRISRRRAREARSARAPRARCQGLPCSPAWCTRRCAGCHASARPLETASPRRSARSARKDPEAGCAREAPPPPFCRRCPRSRSPRRRQGQRWPALRLHPERPERSPRRNRISQSTASRVARAREVRTRPCRTKAGPPSWEAASLPALTREQPEPARPDRRRGIRSGECSPPRAVQGPGARPPAR